MSTLSKFLDQMKSDLKRKEAEAKVLKEQIAELEQVIAARPASVATKSARKPKAKTTTKPARKGVKK